MENDYLTAHGTRFDNYQKAHRRRIIITRLRRARDVAKQVAAAGGWARVDLPRCHHAWKTAQVQQFCSPLHSRFAQCGDCAFGFQSDGGSPIRSHGALLPIAVRVPAGSTGGRVLIQLSVTEPKGDTPAAGSCSVSLAGATHAG